MCLVICIVALIIVIGVLLLVIYLSQKDMRDQIQAMILEDKGIRKSSYLMKSPSIA